MLDAVGFMGIQASRVAWRVAVNGTVDGILDVGTFCLRTRAAEGCYQALALMPGRCTL